MMMKTSRAESQASPIAGTEFIRSYTQHGWREDYITAQRGSAESAEAFFARLAALVPPDALIIEQTVFGMGPDDAAACRQAFPACNWPLTWLTEGATVTPQLAGALVRAISGVPVERWYDHDRVIGISFADPEARYLVMGDLRDTDTSHTDPEQARSVFLQMEQSLAQVEMDFTNVARTWFWNRDILCWYSDFNKVRTTFFQEHGVFERLVPASTGIGGANRFGSALTAAVRAYDPAAEGSISISAIPSPLQCPAWDYGSSFSRAAEVENARTRWLTVSGTASIDPDGKTAFVGNTLAQIALTLEVVYAILQSRGMGWEDVARGIAYFRNAEDARVFLQYCEDAGMAPMPVVLTAMTVCRDDLLFEIEVDCMVEKT